MTDLAHVFGFDLQIGPTGDLAVVSGPVLGQQRVLRRLLTNPGDYIWQLDYGAGLGQFVGQPAQALQIRAVIRSQIFKEVVVARTPEPVIGVQVNDDSEVFVQIRYEDANTGQTQVLSFSPS
jgi:phage baseplate assembly protein W